jgi:phosphatidylglycerol:prolipoprotein diacylglycerol transferase
MSFHGGLIVHHPGDDPLCQKRQIPVLALTDLVAAAGPIGLFLGRIANFINVRAVRPAERSCRGR